MKQILRKNRLITVLEIKVGDLDKSKCSNKFLSHNFDEMNLVIFKQFLYTKIIKE